MDISCAILNMLGGFHAEAALLRSGEVGFEPTMFQRVISYADHRLAFDRLVDPARILIGSFREEPASSPAGTGIRPIG